MTPKRTAASRAERKRSPRMPMDWGLARDYAARDGYLEEMPVTEAEWLATTVPRRMLRFSRERVSDRELRLFAAACCRRIWPLLEEKSRRAVEAAESFADGQISKE